MGTGLKGTFVISWSQTEVDGLDAAPIETLDVGASWSWSGDMVRVDGPSELLRLELAEEEANLRRHAARVVRRLVGAAVANTNRLDDIEVQHPMAESCFVVTDGAASYTVTLIEAGETRPPILMFHDKIPPARTEMWVVHHNLEPALRHHGGRAAAGVICFTPGTRIGTPQGPVAIEDLSEGDWVTTRDNGAQQIQWIGRRRMTGARLHVMPHLRPIRVRVGALGIERPDQELLVSPEHRLLVNGAAARALFNTDEVLVTARDLVDDARIQVDTAARQVIYIHMLLDRHQVIWANGVETESFHPASTSLSTLTDEDRARLLARDRRLESDPHVYGDYARRILSASEAAILRHEAA